MEIIVIAYLIFINVLAVAVTVSDKYTAAHKKHSPRVPERTLLIIAALGGCVSMYITMLIIRHKIKKPKFMITIPIIIMLEAIILFALYSKGLIL